MKIGVCAPSVFDELAPYAFGAFNDRYDTRTHNNVVGFVYLSLRKDISSDPDLRLFVTRRPASAGGLLLLSSGLRR